MCQVRLRRVKQATCYQGIVWLDLIDIVARHRAEIINKEVALNGLRERESELKTTFELLTQQNEELAAKLKTAQEELQTASTTSEDEVNPCWISTNVFPH